MSVDTKLGRSTWMFCFVFFVEHPLYFIKAGPAAKAVLVSASNGNHKMHTRSLCGADDVPWSADT